MNEQDYPPLPAGVRVGSATYLLMKMWVNADRAQQSARHREELLAYEVTVGNLRERGEVVTKNEAGQIVGVTRQDDGRILNVIAESALREQAQQDWPVMPPSIGQSQVLFEDGYAEGWAKCLDACKAMLSAAQQTQPERKPERDRAEEMRAEFHEEMRRDAFGDRA